MNGKFSNVPSLVKKPNPNQTNNDSKTKINKGNGKRLVRATY